MLYVDLAPPNVRALAADVSAVLASLLRPHQIVVSGRIVTHLLRAIRSVIVPLSWSVGGHDEVVHVNAGVDNSKQKSKCWKHELC